MGHKRLNKHKTVEIIRMYLRLGSIQLNSEQNHGFRKNSNLGQVI